jgi:hypothetical protein
VWEYLKLVAHFMWVLLFSGVMAIFALANTICSNVPVLGAIDISPWFWVSASAVGLIVAQALAARELLRRRSDGDEKRVIAENVHYYYGEVHHHHQLPPGDADSS